MQRSFYKRFGLEITLDEGKIRFVNRVNDLIFSEIKEKAYYKNILRYVCERLGEKFSLYTRNNHLGGLYYHGLDRVSQCDFEKTLYILEIVSNIYSEGNINKTIKDVLELSRNSDSVELGIRFHNGLFYLSGDDKLDEEIIEKSLDNINGFKAERDYVKVLKNYLSGNLNSTLGGCFTTLETLSQEVLGNKKGLKANKQEILKYFGGSDCLSKQWSGNINLLYDYLNDYSERHNGNERDNVDVLEVEATLYQTGLIINLLVHKYNETSAIKV